MCCIKLLIPQFCFDFDVMGAFRNQASLESNKRVDLFDGPNDGYAEDNGLLASCKL